MVHHMRLLLSGSRHRISSVTEEATVMPRTEHLRLTSVPNVAELQKDCCPTGTGAAQSVQ